MKATELQLEDLVMYNGCVCRVYGVSMAFPRKEERYDDKAVITLWNNGFIDALEEEINLISLTPEILEKNGWRCYHIDSFGYSSDADWYFYNSGIPARYAKISGKDNKIFLDCPVNYVHEFQHALRLCGFNELANNFKI